MTEHTTAPTTGPWWDLTPERFVAVVIFVLAGLAFVGAIYFGLHPLPPRC